MRYRIRDIAKSFRSYLLRKFISFSSTEYSLSDKSVLIIAPHPDDEVFACGGLIALKKAMNLPVVVVFLTDGESSHQGCCNITKKEVGNIRHQLASNAMDILGVKENDMIWLGLEDGKIPGINENKFKMASKNLLNIIQQAKPGEIYAPHCMDSWPDHESASELVVSALDSYEGIHELYYYPVWMWHNLQFQKFPNLLKSKIVHINIRSAFNKKKLAIKEYLSKINPGCGKPFCGDLPNGFVQNFYHKYEVFFKS